MAAHVKVVPCHSFHSYVYWVTQISQGLNKKRDTNSAHYCDIIVNTLSLSVSVSITTSYIVYWTLYRISDCESERTTRSNVLWFISLMWVVLSTYSSFESLIIREVSFLKPLFLSYQNLNVNQSGSSISRIGMIFCLLIRREKRL